MLLLLVFVLIFDLIWTKFGVAYFWGISEAFLRYKDSENRK